MSKFIGGVIDLAVDEATQGIKRAFTSTGGDGGQNPNKRHAGAVEVNQFRAPQPRQLGVHEKAHAAYAMVKDLQPRTKSVSWMIFNNHLLSQSTPTRIYTGSDGKNTAILLHDRSDIADETIYFNQVDVIPSGLSLTMRESGQTMSPMIGTAIFPLSHPALIQKGDDFNERLGDYIHMSALHLTGRIQAEVFYAMFDPAAPFSKYVPSANSLEAVSRPRSLYLDPQRKVRLMLVQTFDNLSQAFSSDVDDETYYNNTDWFETKANASGTISRVQKMRIVGAPRLENILDVDGNKVADITMRAKANVREFAENGRWKKIDRKYRSNHKNENVWLDPTTARRVAFKVISDTSFTLKPSELRRRVDDVDDVRGAYNRHSYVDVDMFIKLNMPMSYPTQDAGQDVSSVDSRASANYFFYLFDDHVDSLTLGGLTDPTNSVDGYNKLDDVVEYGYTMCTAQLKLDVFFTDDL